jgi:hypothetical protein
MKMNKLMMAILGMLLLTACQNETNSKTTTATATENWRLGWRMMESYWNDMGELGALQFDSLLNSGKELDHYFLQTGLEIKSNLGKKEEVIKLLNQQEKSMLSQICTKSFLKNLEPCIAFSEEQVENKTLQLELIKMYVDDQAARGNIMKNIIFKYQLDSTEVTTNGAIIVDERNRNRLKEIFKEIGFPTRKLVGKEAMNGIFLIIQHADNDKEWQKSQLKNIKKAVEKGDIPGQSYAYLYDRIKVNSGEKQLYGTQFKKVNRAEKIVELADTEDIVNLDERRMKMGMMPIDMYKAFMLKGF